MRRRLPILPILLALLAPAAPATSADPETPTAEGRWGGAIQLPAGELAIAVDLARGDDGAWTGTVDIPAQSLAGFELAAVRVDGDEVHFEMAGIPGRPTFDGRLSGAGEAISGTFTQGSQSLRFWLERAGEDDGPAGKDAALGLPAEPVAGEGVVGEWLGVLDAGPMKLRLALHVEERDDGSLAAVVDSVDQGAEIPVEAISFERGVLRLEITGIGASYEGTLADDGSAVAGSWSQGGRSLPLTFHRLAETFALARPQRPEGPFPYSAEEVTFESPAGDVELAGTLVVPEGEGPFPAVAMASGSGPQDRDESLMGHEPFLVVADHLARRGVASLRWDDRGAGESGGDHFASTVDDFAADVAAAVEFLAGRPRIDPDAVGVVGHSEGGVTGPMAASASGEVDFLVLLAPPAVPLPELLLRQAADILRLQGAPDELAERALAWQAEDLALVADPELSAEELGERLHALLEQRQAELSGEEREILQANEAASEQAIRVASSPWFRSLLRQDPATHLRRIEVPVLALFGGRDVQVAAEVNAEALRAALTAGGNRDFEVRVLPGLNHLFQHAETGAPAEYGAIEETFAPEALEAISDWIASRYGA